MVYIQHDFVLVLDFIHASTIDCWLVFVFELSMTNMKASCKKDANLTLFLTLMGNELLYDI